MSFKEAIKSIITKLPAVTSPKGDVHLKRKLAWTFGILILYFALSNVPLFGLSSESTDLFERYRLLFAGTSGTLMFLGVYPLVSAQIIFSLLGGGGVIKEDLVPHGQAILRGTKKLLVFIVIFWTTMLLVVGGYIKPSIDLANTIGVDPSILAAGLFFQIFMGGVLILLLHEIGEKWGAISGGNLFILAGISHQLINGIINWKVDEGLPIGLIPRWIYFAQTGLPDGFVDILVDTGFLALIGTIVIFFIVVFVESSRIEIPLAHSAVTGARGRFPIKLLYAGHVPLIMTLILLANINTIGMILADNGITILGVSGSTPTSGLMYYLAPIHGPHSWIPYLVEEHYTSMDLVPPEVWQIGLRVITNAVMMIIGCIIFALTWVETTGMGTKNVAQNIYRSGMQIPGFKRSPQSIERIMERYIPRVTIIGGGIIGALAVMSSLTGIVGGLEGTYLLLAVGIVYQLYEDLASERMMDIR